MVTMIKEIIAVLLVLLGSVFSLPAGDYVVNTLKVSEKNGKDATNIPVDPIIYQMDIHTNVSNRFAQTLVTSKVRNPNKESKETTFTVVLPQKAFISGFILQIGGKDYKAYVKEKEEAKKIYEVARARGQTAGHVAVSARDSNTFTISVNVEPDAKAAFLLTYEELLERKNNRYELVLNIHPGQVVDKLDVKVVINESRPLSFIRTPSLRTGNEVDKNLDSSNELSKVEMIEKKTAIVKFHPDRGQQKQFAIKFGKAETEGLAGQFVVQYDVQRDPNGGEVLLKDGYFVHFFAPDNLEPLPKHIVFVLDTSGSMMGRRIKQLRDAMNNIIEQLRPGDEVSLIEFNTNVYVWNIESQQKHQVTFNNYEDPFATLEAFSLPKPASINSNNKIKIKAKKVIARLYAEGTANIIGGLDAALSVVKAYTEEKNEKNKNLQPIIMFLTDGEPMGLWHVNSKKNIHKIISKLNANNNGVPIFALSFGDRADKSFLRKLSLENSGFSRHIYEGADASLQLENFYKEISVPLLSDIKFEYADTVNVTKLRQPVFFKGSEIAICGMYDPALENPLDSVKIRGIGNGGQISLVPSIEKPVSSLERLWAYLTVKNKLEKRETVETDLEKHKITQEALQIALKYSFVTDVTSLVVVKPNDTYDSTDPHRPIPRPSTRPFPRSSTRPFPRPSPTRFELGRPTIYPASFSANSYATWPPPTSRRYPYYSPNINSASFNPGFQSALRPPVVYPLYYNSSGNAGLQMSRGGRYHNSYSPGSSGIYVSTPYVPRRTTTLTTELPSTTTMSIDLVSKLKKDLPWLESVLSSNGTLKINEGNFELGDATLNVNEGKCSNAPLNRTGLCTLLKDCPEAYSYLTEFQTYQQYFCPISNKFAGVCCPKEKTTKMISN